MSPVDLERIKQHALACKSNILKASENMLTDTESRLTQDVLTLVAEVEALRADLAAARAELEHISKVWPSVSSGDIHDVDHTLFRLSTGEALAAVREAQAALAQATFPEYGIALVRQVNLALARLQAVFGEDLTSSRRAVES